MTEKQYKDYSDMLIKDIVISAGPLDAERYSKLMRSIQELVKLVGDSWRDKYHDDLI